MFPQHVYSIDGLLEPSYESRSEVMVTRGHAEAREACSASGIQCCVCCLYSRASARLPTTKPKPLIGLIVQKVSMLCKPPITRKVTNVPSGVEKSGYHRPFPYFKVVYYRCILILWRDIGVCVTQQVRGLKGVASNALT